MHSYPFFSFLYHPSFQKQQQCVIWSFELFLARYGSLSLTLPAIEPPKPNVPAPRELAAAELRVHIAYRIPLRTPPSPQVAGPQEKYCTIRASPPTYASIYIVKSLFRVYLQFTRDYGLCDTSTSRGRPSSSSFYTPAPKAMATDDQDYYSGGMLPVLRRCAGFKIKTCPW